MTIKIAIKIRFVGVKITFSYWDTKLLNLKKFAGNYFHAILCEKFDYLFLVHDKIIKLNIVPVA